MTDTVTVTQSDGAPAVLGPTLTDAIAAVRGMVDQVTIASQTAQSQASHATSAATAIDFSATAVLDNLNAFLAYYLGAFSADPTLDGAGNALTPKATYVNTNTGKLRLHATGSWADYDASAVAAASSASTASAAAIAAEQAILAFWCGAASSDPSVNGNGGALTTAGIYFNTTSGKLRTHASGAWADYDATVQTALASAVTQATAAAGSATAAATSNANTQTLFNSVSSLALAAAASANAASAVSGLSNLSAVARAVMLATDAVVAQPIACSRDSDAGAWRGKCAQTSWVSAFGAFPQDAGVVGRTTANTLSIISRSDPAGPIWASWTIAGFTTAKYLNGFLRYGGTGGLYTLDFVADQIFRRDTSGNWRCTNQTIATYNQSTATWALLDSNALPSNTISDIDMTVLPLTALNPLRADLPHVTTAMATSSGGVSVIRADGVVCNASNVSAFSSVLFDKNYNLWIGRNASSVIYLAASPTYLLASWNATQFTFSSSIGNFSTAVRAAANGDVFIGGNSGLGGVARIKPDLSNPTNSMMSVKNAFYDTGWMPGAGLSSGAPIRSAIAESSANLAALAANVVLSDDFSSYANTAALVAVYALSVGGDPYNQIALSGSGATGALQLSGDGTNHGQAICRSFATIVGETYAFTYTTTNGLVNIRLGTFAGGTSYYNTAVPSGTRTIYFTATTAATFVMLYAPITATTTLVDNITCTQICADRSSAANHATIDAGVTLTRSIVATGSERAAYSGFSASGGLTIPYAAGFDPASGDVEIGCEIAITAAIAKTVTFGDRANPAGTGAFYRLDTDSSGKPRFTISDGTNTVSATGSVALGAGNHEIWGARRTATGTIECWCDGVRVASAAATTVGSLSNASAVLRVGLTAAGAAPMDVAGPGIATIKVAMCASTPDQVVAMWAAHNQLMQVNAKSLLLGSATVQGLSYDSDTDQLAVATAVGTNLFKGLARVGYQQSTLGANLWQMSQDVPGTSTLAGATLGSLLSTTGPTGWGAGAAWKLIEGAGTGTHRDYRVISLTSGVTYYFAQPVKVGERNWTFIGPNSTTVGAYFNASTGAYGTVLGGATTYPALDLGNGWWLPIVSFVPGTTTSYGVGLCVANASPTFSYTGDGASGLYVGKPLLSLTQPTASSYSDGLAASDNHKSVVFAGSDLLIGSAAGVDMFMTAASGLRETVKGQGAPKRAFYDPTRAQFAGVTTDATPTVVSETIIPEGKAFRFRATVVGVQYGGTATEKVVYVIEGIASRDIGGNVSVTSTTTTVSEVTASMDCAASANTTAQTLEIKVTGKASTRVVWLEAREHYDAGLMLAA